MGWTKEVGHDPQAHHTQHAVLRRQFTDTAGVNSGREQRPDLSRSPFHFKPLVDEIRHFRHIKVKLEERRIKGFALVEKG